MKLKQSVLIIMAAALPVVSFAASEVIPVTQDTVNVQANQTNAKRVNRNDLTYRISSTATPEQNRALRSKASKVDRNAVEVVAPNADRYMDRKEVAVSPVESTTDHLDLVFPEVKSVSPAVEKAINTTIKKYVSKIQNDVEKLNAKESDKTNVVMYYDVKTDKNGIFSVLIHTYTMRDHDANGVNYVKGFTFNTTTGRQLSLYDLGGLNKKELVNAINNNQDVKDKLGGDVNIDKMPTEFYTTDDYSVVMILQQDVDAIHSAGTNWSYYSHYVGDIFGAPLAIEALLAFFLESTFFGLFLFGWDRLSKRQHLLATYCVAFGSNLSAMWILVANGWMQSPIASEFNFETMRMEMTNFMELWLNPVAQSKFLHTLSL